MAAYVETGGGGVKSIARVCIVGGEAAAPRRSERPLRAMDGLGEPAEGKEEDQLRQDPSTCRLSGDGFLPPRLASLE